MKEREAVSIESNWKQTLSFFEERFGEGLDLDAVLFLIGIQELGKGMQDFNKDEKTDVLHIAVCTLLEPYGFYEYIGNDEAGWPHFKRTEKLPFLTPQEQDKLIKEAIADYVERYLSSN